MSHTENLAEQRVKQLLAEARQNELNNRYEAMTTTLNIVSCYKAPQTLEQLKNIKREIGRELEILKDELINRERYIKDIEQLIKQS